MVNIAGNRVQAYVSIGPNEVNGTNIGQHAVDGDLPVADRTPLDNFFSQQTQLFDSGPLPENNHSLKLTTSSVACCKQTYWLDFIVYTTMFYDDDVELMALSNSSSNITSELQPSSTSSALSSSSPTTNRSPHAQLSIALPIALIVSLFLIATVVFLCLRRRRLKVRSPAATAGLIPVCLACTPVAQYLST
jgi:hypothetical protein